ncbi:MAG: hypothetical protein RJQ00_03845 [Vicingaceae bacterium]
MSKCKICKKILKGRADKIFCSVTCKNLYHVTLRKVTKTTAKSIDEILHRNRSILLEILGKNAVQKKVNRLILSRKKFNYKHLTHFNINSKGKMYHYLYDIAWMEFSDDEILIVRRK